MSGVPDGGDPIARTCEMSSERRSVRAVVVGFWPIRKTVSDVLNVDEAAKFLRVGKSRLYDAIGRGEVPHVRIGKTIRLSRAALVAWLAGPRGA